MTIVSFRNVLETRASVGNCVDPAELYKALRFLEPEYPGFEDWYFGKVLPGFFHGQREIFVKIVDSSIAGVVICKNDPDERKICTFLVIESFQGKNVGSELMLRTLRELGTNHPVITVSESRLSFFNNLFERFGFHLSEIVFDMYRENVAEYVYNLPSKLDDNDKLLTDNPQGNLLVKCR